MSQENATQVSPFSRKIAAILAESWYKILDISEIECKRIGAHAAEHIAGIRTTDVYFSHQAVDIRLLAIQMRLRWINEPPYNKPRGEYTVKGPILNNDERNTLRKPIAVESLMEYYAMLIGLGFIPHTVRQKIRDRYTVHWDYGTMEIQVDKYPGIPAYAEVTGDLKNKESFIKQLKVPADRLVSLTASGVFAHYGVPDSTKIIFQEDCSEHFKRDYLTALFNQYPKPA